MFYHLQDPCAFDQIQVLRVFLVLIIPGFKFDCALQHNQQIHPDLTRFVVRWLFHLSQVKEESIEAFFQRKICNFHKRVRFVDDKRIPEAPL